MKKCLNDAILHTHRNSLHSDIVTQFENISTQREDKNYESFRESHNQKFDRLAEEFDTIREVETAEKNFVNNLVDSPDDTEKWGEFAQFCLRYGMQIKAEQCLYKKIECSGGEMDVDMRLFLAALLVQR